MTLLYAAGVVVFLIGAALLGKGIALWVDEEIDSRHV